MGYQLAYTLSKLAAERRQEELAQAEKELAAMRADNYSYSPLAAMRKKRDEDALSARIEEARRTGQGLKEESPRPRRDAVKGPVRFPACGAPEALC